MKGERFAIGSRVRVNIGRYYGHTGVIFGRYGKAWQVRLDNIPFTSEYRESDLLDVYANNGD
jgi:hypothetical protein